MLARNTEVVYTNDAGSGPTNNRNLLVDWVEVDGQTVQAELVLSVREGAGGAIKDWGSGTAAFDCVNVEVGSHYLYANGALRTVVGDRARALCYDANGDPSLCSGQAWRLEDGVAYEQSKRISRGRCRATAAKHRPRPNQAGAWW